MFALLSLGFILFMPVLPMQQILGKSVSFEKIYAENIGFVQFVVAKFRLASQESDELVQEVFLRFHQSRSRVDETKVRAYLATTARNMAIDVLRKQKSRKTFEMDEHHDVASEDGLWRDDPRRVLESEVAAAFLKELEAETGAETLLYFYRDGLSVREIAEKLGESTGTITSRLTRLRQKFKERLQGQVDKIFVME